MNSTNPNYFFDTSAYQHSSLFTLQDHVWKALVALESYFKTLKLGVIEGEVSENAYLIDQHLIFIGKGTVVEPGAYIKGPCYIGNDCTIRHGAYVRGNVITGNKCVIGHDTEIKNSIMLDGAHAAHFAYVGDTILGNRVNLGAGTICANLLLEGKTVYVHSRDQPINTGMRKLGAIIGDDTQIGCNTVTNPGALIGKGVHCYPTLNVGGFIPSQSLVKGQKNFTIEGRS